MMKTFDDLVESWEQVVTTPMDIRNVHLRDGRRFYTRYRQGRITLNRDDDPDGRMVLLHHGGDFPPAVLADAEWKDLFLKLARLHPDIDTTGSTELKELISAAETALTYIEELRMDPFARTAVSAALVVRLRAAVKPFDKDYS